MNRTWCVLESNTGFITLSVSDGDDLIYIHTGYQLHPPEQLKNDLAALSMGDDPRSWDGNLLITSDQITNRGRELPKGKLRPEANPFNFPINLNITSKVICTQDGPLPENMGAAGKRLFAI